IQTGLRTAPGTDTAGRSVGRAHPADTDGAADRLYNELAAARSSLAAARSGADSGRRCHLRSGTDGSARGRHRHGPPLWRGPRSGASRLPLQRPGLSLRPGPGGSHLIKALLPSPGGKRGNAQAQSHEMDTILGIDLGTTNSEIAIIREGQPHVFLEDD